MSRAEPQRDVAPPAFLQLAGHPLRWGLLGELARSDRTVRELTALVGQPQNLVSYHLGKLRDAGLVAARRSSADGRDAYYRVDLSRFRQLLTATGEALHPGLGPLPPTPSRRASRTKRRVLFLCTGNSARSQMAEALARARSNGLVNAYSAGSHPKPLHPSAVRALREEYGIDIGAQRSKHVSRFVQRSFDQVVTLCDRVREVSPDFAGSPTTVHWSIADPAGGAAADDADAGYRAFVQTAAELDGRISFLLADLAAPTTAP